MRVKKNNYNEINNCFTVKSGLISSIQIIVVFHYAYVQYVCYNELLYSLINLLLSNIYFFFVIFLYNLKIHCSALKLTLILVMT